VIDPRALAVQGIGFGRRLLAMLGIGTVATPAPAFVVGCAHSMVVERHTATMSMRACG